jgi:phospholipid-transporting ATPase
MLMELCKVGITLLIEYDTEMYSLEQSKHTKCLNVNLHEDLGLVKYILTDKTGTLTTNDLKFKGATIGNQLFYQTNEEELYALIKEQLQGDLLNEQSFEDILEELNQNTLTDSS